MQRYAITDGAPGRQVEAWALAGVEWIQIREPGMAQEKLALLGKELATICRKAACGTRLLVNGLDADAALLAGAHGVHLHGGTSVAQVHAARAAGALVSVSCHTLADAQHAVQGSANALLWAPVYGKMVDGRVVVPGSGLAALSEACRVAGDTPVFALGGITAQNAEECVRAGAAGVAGIRLFADEQWRSLCARPV
jgi:thiamine-phosphate pyrophosphorylase